MDADSSSPISKGNSGSLINRTVTMFRGTKGSNKMETIYNMAMEGSMNRHGDQMDIDRSSPGSKGSSRSMANQGKTIIKGTKGPNRI